MTPEQILALSDNDSIRKNAQKLGRVSAWLKLNANEHVVWGEIKGSGKEPYQVRFDLLDLGFKCSCPSHQQPCKHTLALMLIHVDEAAAFGHDAPPPWVTSWVASREAKAVKKASAKTSTSDPEGQAKRVTEREEKVSAGIDALDLWLRDLVRGGFDGLPSRGAAFWETPAARMVDAQAKGLANQLQEMAKIPGSSVGWASSLLENVGMLYLLLEGYRHQETLPPDLRTDVRSIVGWNQKQDDLLDAALPAVRDQWMVLSQRSHEQDRMDIQRTWLRGLKSGRDALHLEFSFNSAPFELKLPAGSCFDAEVVYYPSHYPQRVLLRDRRMIQPPDHVEGQTIAQAIAAYAEALSRQPWLNLFPMLLKNIYPAHSEHGWILRDAEGHFLPLGAFVESGWKLLGLSGGSPLTVFGEWDGQRFMGLTTWVDGRIIPV